MSITKDFEDAALEVKDLKATPADDELLELYALYKQGSVGDVNIARPGLLDFKGKAKWDAWEKKKGVAQEQAKEQYVAKVKELVEKYGKK